MTTFALKSKHIGSRLLYFFVILPVSYLPFWLLYGLSDLLHLVLYRILGYRRKVVSANIANSFPNSSAAYRKSVESDFYRHFCDLIVESLKVFSITSTQVKSRMRMTNPEVLKPYFEQGRSAILAGGHYGNWEMFAVAIRQGIEHEAIALYKPLSNAYFDELMRKTRSRYGLEMISVREVKTLFENLHHRKPSLLIFGSDQSPGDPRKAYWMDFLNQDTAVMFGIEKYALEYNLPVFYGKIEKVKRGYSTFTLELLVDQPAGMRHGELTELHTRRLEKDIIAEPRYWLWTHRRWKRKRSEITDSQTKI